MFTAELLVLIFLKKIKKGEYFFTQKRFQGLKSILVALYNYLRFFLVGNMKIPFPAGYVILQVKTKLVDGSTVCVEICVKIAVIKSCDCLSSKILLTWSKEIESVKVKQRLYLRLFLLSITARI